DPTDEGRGGDEARSGAHDHDPFAEARRGEGIRRADEPGGDPLAAPSPPDGGDRAGGAARAGPRDISRDDLSSGEESLSGDGREARFAPAEESLSGHGRETRFAAAEEPAPAVPREDCPDPAA
ncbi:MAG TPA: hypothetical protein VF587_17780, partial [Solirubrobacteraceae bacterium]